MLADLLTSQNTLPGFVYLREGAVVGVVLFSGDAASATRSLGLVVSCVCSPWCSCRGLFAEGFSERGALAGYGRLWSREERRGL